MSEESQIVVPASFIALFVAPGRQRPSLPRDALAARYELCEDLAEMLTEPAQTQRWDLGIAEGDVLKRIHRGLLGDAAGLAAAEAVWVATRLAELLQWECPLWDDAPAD
jgi:hypothetical protein